MKTKDKYKMSLSPGAPDQTPTALLGHGIRRQKGLTRERFADLLDVSGDFLSLIDRGNNAPPFETLEKMAKRLRGEPRDRFDLRES